LHIGISSSPIYIQPYAAHKLKMMKVFLVVVLSCLVIGVRGQKPNHCVTGIGYSTKDLPGSPHYNIISWEQCGELCLKEANCKYWTWHIIGKYQNLCFLKYSNAKIQRCHTCISGSKRCHKQGPYFFIRPVVVL